MTTFTASKKNLESSKIIGRYVKEYWQDIYSNPDGKKTCWATGLAPVELLIAADIVPVLPENYNALLSAKQMGAEMCEEAERRGFSSDTCSYARMNIGNTLSGKGVYGALPVPDFLLCTRNVCSTHFKWWHYLAKLLDRPLFILDVPQVGRRIEEHQARYFVSQVKDLVEFCGKVSGRKVTENRLLDVLEKSSRFGDIWTEIRDFRKHIPCPISSSDIFGNMFLAVTLPGTDIAINLISKLRDEVAERVRCKQGAIPDEKFRLMWDNIAIWYNLGLMNYLEDRGAVCAIETYTCYTGWGEQLDLSKGPYESLLHKYMGGYLNLDLEVKIDLVKRIVKDFSIDGVIFFSNRSCKPYSMGQYNIRSVLEKAGVPGVEFEADMVDPRLYSDAIIKNRLDTFLEII